MRNILKEFKEFHEGYLDAIHFTEEGLEELCPQDELQVLKDCIDFFYTAYPTIQDLDLSLSLRSM